MSLDDSLFDFSELDVSECDDNEVLPPEEALSLLKNLYARPAQKSKSWKSESLSILEHFLGEELPNLMSMIPMESPEMIQHFRHISSMTAAALEQTRLPMLRGKTVIGVGGAFSAGKSSFLNALTGLGKLPENQGPTTAVGTYILHGEKPSIQAFTRYGRLVHLDDKTLRSISHDFFDEYHIGFADILHKVIITTDAPLPDGIVLLDTPGYNKPDQSHQDGPPAQDNHIAHQHLLGCDYLIWLVSVDSGEIIHSDINFLKNLELRHGCLFIVNKADLKPEEQVLEVVTKIEETVASSGIPCFGVTAYSAYEEKEWLGRNLLNQFMDEASRTKHPQDCISDVKKIRDLWHDAFTQQKRKLDDFLGDLERAISDSNGAQNILGMIEIYRSIKAKSTSLYHSQHTFIESVESNRMRLQDLLS